MFEGPCGGASYRLTSQRVVDAPTASSGGGWLSRPLVATGPGMSSPAYSNLFHLLDPSSDPPRPLCRLGFQDHVLFQRRLSVRRILEVRLHCCSLLLELGDRVDETLTIRVRPCCRQVISRRFFLAPALHSTGQQPPLQRV